MLAFPCRNGEECRMKGCAYRHVPPCTNCSGDKAKTHTFEECGAPGGPMNKRRLHDHDKAMANMAIRQAEKEKELRDPIYQLVKSGFTGMNSELLDRIFTSTNIQDAEALNVEVTGVLMKETRPTLRSIVNGILAYDTTTFSGIVTEKRLAFLEALDLLGVKVDHALKVLKHRAEGCE
jgi:hypothetical protein